MKKKRQAVRYRKEGIANKPYEEMGGNWSAKRIMEEVKKLPIHKSDYVGGENNNASA